MRTTRFLLALVGIMALMGQSRSCGFYDPPEEGAVVKFTSAVYKDKNGNNQTAEVTQKDKGVSLPGVAADNDVVLKGNFSPAGNGTVTMIISSDGPPPTTDMYSPTISAANGTWTVTIPKDKWKKGAVYSVEVNVTINGQNATDTYTLNIANN